MTPRQITATAIQRYHRRLEWAVPPTGWCSWYFYGPRVTEADILANLGTINEHKVDLRYIQIDDGFQAKMGDWLIPTEKFPSGLPALCRRIRDAGFRAQRSHSASHSPLQPARRMPPIPASGSRRAS